MNKVILQPYKRTVDTELIHIESEYYYLSPAQVPYEPKERGT